MRSEEEVREMLEHYKEKLGTLYATDTVSVDRTRIRIRMLTWVLNEELPDIVFGPLVEEE